MRFIRENWGSMLNAGSDTFWEAPVKNPEYRIDGAADRFIGESHCHGWTAGPTYALLSEVVGIKPTAPGFREFEVKPRLGNLAFVKGVVPTPMGLIAVSINRTGARFELVILIPEGSQANISLPKLADNPAVFLDGKQIVLDLATDENRVCINIKIAGKHVLTAGNGEAYGN
ncbi:MAG: hypothetical protein NT118_01125 [Lentisphaerae bacterium]|nr:hypothetical protein [Lentisphaerota bacterium]